ncbi:MAG: dimethyl sulfoxide reductase anchor subunit [Nitrospinae bacterium]|nr:dimethyl sulfoxide reductase anchor subunit [Nitrospinota bacterium]
MHPELSLILLTVLAGVGQGLFAFLVGADIRLSGTGGLPADAAVAGAGAALAFTLAGTAASFFHLTHPERGWKAILQWKKSWLSREVVLLPAFQGLAALYGLCAYAGVDIWIRYAVGSLGIVAALWLYLASGMLYAKIRFIKEWSNVYTPINYALVGLATGSVAGVAVLELLGAPAEGTLAALRGAFAVMSLGLLTKAMSYHHNAHIYSSTNAQTATGFSHSLIKLMDMGVSYDHYNTKEYAYRTGLNRSVLRAVALLILFVVPFVVLTMDYMPLLSGSQGSMAVVAALLAVTGAFLERWLFFTDGNHAQNLYYGNFIEKGISNPLLQRAKAGTPAPR